MFLNINNFKEMCDRFGASGSYDNFHQYVIAFDDVRKFVQPWANGKTLIKRIDFIIDREFDVEEGTINVCEKHYDKMLSLSFECDELLVVKDFKEQFTDMINYRIKFNEETEHN